MNTTASIASASGVSTSTILERARTRNIKPARYLGSAGQGAGDWVCPGQAGESRGKREGMSMGMYTELAINVKLKPGTPKDVLDLLRKMCGDDDVTMQDVPVEHWPHPFFHTERWAWCLRSGGSYYFHCLCTRRFQEQDEIDKCCALMVWTNIKNYSSEWEHFLAWLAPFIKNEGCSSYIGHMQSEESERPTLLYADGGTVTMEVPEIPDRPRHVTP